MLFFRSNFTIIFNTPPKKKIRKRLLREKIEREVIYEHISRSFLPIDAGYNIVIFYYELFNIVRYQSILA